MKKIFSILLIACVAMLFSACQKEGVYNPSKKISKVYFTDANGNKSLSQVWSWNKNNTLEKIENYSSNGTLANTLNFTYEKKRLTRMNNYTANAYIEYKYDKNGLKEANLYAGGTMLDTYTFTYEKGKLTKITDTYIHSKAVDNDLQMSPLQFILPEEMYTATEEARKQFEPDNSKATTVFTYELTWDNNNITKLVRTMSGSSANFTLEAKYDKYNNPFKGAFLNFYFEDNVTDGNFCKNNATRLETTSVTDGGNVTTNVYTYEYSYDGKWPVSRRFMGENSTLTEFEYTK